MIARAVIEQMDDHKVHTFVSLAGVQNGVFYGSQDDDRDTVQVLTTGFGAATLPPTLFDFSFYSGETSRGQMQHDWTRRSMDHELQTTYSMVNLGRTPVRDVFLDTNWWFPMVSNVNKCWWFDFRCHMEKIPRKKLPQAEGRALLRVNGRVQARHLGSAHAERARWVVPLLSGKRSS
ncbi:hypothetical protein PRIC1_014199 [Phytophthora ramorum]|nr:hypothetical protein KRP22_10349 [Phytophthora ramorum]